MKKIPIYILKISSVLLILTLSACNSGNVGGSASNGSMNTEIQQISQSNAIKQDQQLKMSAQTFVDDFLKNHTKDTEITAMTLTMACNSFNSGTAIAGVMGKHNNTPVPADAVFRIGSITKSFVSVIVLQLASEGKISLNDKVGSYFPEYSRWSNITIRQLMNMTSGMKDYDAVLPQLSDPAFEAYMDPTTYVLNPLAKLDLLFTPGNGWNYANPAYILLGLLVENITQQKLEDVITARITGKLNMQDTFFVRNLPFDVVEPKLVVNGMLVGTYPDGSKVEIDETNRTLSWDFAAGNILSTSQDINKYVHALFKSGLILNDNEIKELTTLYSLTNGQPVNKPSENETTLFGLGVSAQYLSNNYPFIYTYTGSEPGYIFAYYYDPKTGHSVSYGVNGYPSDNDMVWYNNNILNMLNTLNSICE